MRTGAIASMLFLLFGCFSCEKRPNVVDLDVMVQRAQADATGLASWEKSARAVIPLQVDFSFVRQGEQFDYVSKMRAVRTGDITLTHAGIPSVAPLFPVVFTDGRTGKIAGFRTPYAFVAMDDFTQVADDKSPLRFSSEADLFEVARHRSSGMLGVITRNVKLILRDSIGLNDFAKQFALDSLRSFDAAGVSYAHIPSWKPLEQVLQALASDGRVTLVELEVLESEFVAL